MALWIIFALMTGAAIFAVLWPLSRRGPERGGSDIAVYRDQLDEIGRDRAAGRIGEAEAEAAKVEVSRRLLAAADAAEAQQQVLPEAPVWRRRAAAVAALVLLPAGAVALYLALGSPQMPGVPLATRQTAANENRSVETLVAQVEDHVARNPEDGRGWEVLAPVYMRLGRFNDAARAWRNAIRLNGSNASREADMGEAITAAANGVVTAEAKAAFDRAIALDPNDVMARFYQGMAAEQDGRRTEAEKIWRDLLASAPPGAPWVEVVRHALERASPAGPQAPATASGPAVNAPGPSAAELAAGEKLAPDQQNQMVAGMVSRLAERLKQDGSDVEGWLRLVRSYRILGQNDKAQEAVADARRALANDPDKLRQFAAGTGAAAPAAPPLATAPSAPGPSAADIAAGQQLAPDQQNQMIAGMVSRLAERLKQDGSDVEGWLRLVRAYGVLGERDKAKTAADDARRALASDPAKVRRVDDLAKELGLQG